MESVTAVRYMKSAIFAGGFTGENLRSSSIKKRKT